MYKVEAGALGGRQASGGSQSASLLLLLSPRRTGCANNDKYLQSGEFGLKPHLYSIQNLCRIVGRLTRVVTGHSE